MLACSPFVGDLKLVKTKKRCCKSKQRCKRCPVVCKRLADDGLAVRHDKRHYLVEIAIPKKTFNAARAR
jgi:aldehyde:ferredoxin oxidoreductase